ncbi:MAG: hypothetical protein RR288_00605, partial [Oscillibacter sp.]
RTRVPPPWAAGLKVFFTCRDKTIEFAAHSAGRGRPYRERTFIRAGRDAVKRSGKANFCESTLKEGCLFER